ncbi:MAG: hypothetical protein ABR509_02700 [Candidatus Limnocylindria bacterium]
MTEEERTGEAVAAIDARQRRQLAVDLFNHVWTLLEKQDRSAEDEDAMVHAAHASRHHWGEVGEPVNLARGEWQISRVYSVLARGEPALYHARRCLELCEANGIGDFDLAYAYEAMSRAYHVAHVHEASRQYADMAREAGDAIAEEDDRALFRSDIADLPGASTP